MKPVTGSTNIASLIRPATGVQPIHELTPAQARIADRMITPKMIEALLRPRSGAGGGGQAVGGGAAAGGGGGGGDDANSGVGGGGAGDAVSGVGGGGDADSGAGEGGGENADGCGGVDMRSVGEGSDAGAAGVGGSEGSGGPGGSVFGLVIGPSMSLHRPDGRSRPC